MSWVRERGGSWVVIELHLWSFFQKSHNKIIIIFIIKSYELARPQIFMEKTRYIAVIPGVGFSHLAPILQFSKQLVELHPHFHVTCIVPSLGSLPSASKAILETLPPNYINTILLPPVNHNDQLSKEDIPVLIYKIRLNIKLD